MARETGLLSMLRRIADAVEVLPEVKHHLEGLSTGVAEMSAEVTKMREGVERLEVAVKDLNGGVDGLDDQFQGMRGEIRELDRHLGHIKKALQPLRALAGVGRIGDRLRNT